MEEILLNAEQRQITGKMVKQLRHKGYVPGVLYGHYTEPINLRIEQRALYQAVQEAGMNRLITLNIKGIRDPRRVLVRELQRDAITHTMLHVDLYEVIMTERITTEVSIVLTGESPMVQDGEGLVFQGLDNIEIECLPGDLPPQIEVDITGLDVIDATILVSDLKLSDAIEILTDAEEIVVRILPPAREEIEEVVEVEEVAEVEVVGEEEEGPEAEAEEEAKSGREQ